MHSPIVVELFESQGCSSCPPAEAVMNQLKKEFGDSVLLLGFHVDYWDYLGWKDPFSSAEFTARQKEYAQRFGQDSMYTPEMVIAGQVGFVGSDARRADTEVRRALEQTIPAPRITANAIDATHLKILFHDGDERFKKARLTAVLYEDAPPVHVLRGENAGATMSGDHAVRSLKEMPAVENSVSEIIVPVPAARGAGAWKAVVLITAVDGRLQATSPIPLP